MFTQNNNLSVEKHLSGIVRYLNINSTAFTLNLKCQCPLKKIQAEMHIGTLHFGRLL